MAADLQFLEQMRAKVAQVQEQHDAMLREVSHNFRTRAHMA